MLNFEEINSTSTKYESAYRFVSKTHNLQLVTTAEWDSSVEIIEA